MIRPGRFNGLKVSLGSGSLLMWIVVAGAQGPAQMADPADWVTDGGDPQRAGWQQHETVLSPDTIKDMRLLWRIHLDNQPREMHALFPPLIAGRVTTARGSKQIAVVAGVSDNLYGIDVHTGSLLWKTHFSTTFTPAPGNRGSSFLCPGGQTATPVIAATSTPGKYVLYAVSWDGRLRTVDVATGEEIESPASFMPPNGKPGALNLWNGVISTTTSQGCGDNPNLAYAFDLATRTVSRYSPATGGMWGRRGPSIGADGSLFTGTDSDNFDRRSKFSGEAVVALGLDPITKGLYLKDYFSPANAEWMYKHDLDIGVTGPVFRYKGRELIAQSSKECRIWLLDTASLGGQDHRTPLSQTPLMCNEGASYESAGVWGALTTWQDIGGTRWILSPFWGPKQRAFHAPFEYGAVTHGAVAAFKLDDSHGTYQLMPAWISRDMNRADPPVVANGLVFAYGSGESTKQRWENPRHIDGTAGRIAESTHAVLYALDAQTGRELWSSGDQILSWNHSSGLSVANGRVYIATYDGSVYSFGIRAS
jgi:hypothetical protein